MSAPTPTYAYHAAYLSNHDADTIVFRVDRGRTTHGILDDPTWTVRLYGFDAWEMTGPDRAKGVLARQFAQSLLTSARQITVQTIHPALRATELEKYGRVLARVWVDDEELSDLLRAAGHEKRLGPTV